jgi:hypothetical protein
MATLLFCIVLAASAFGTDHLLITEFCVTPTDGEFVEIYNPTGSTVDLTDYYLADYIYNNDNDYINIVDDTDSGYYQDFLAKFPDGATIDADEYQVISIHDNDQFEAEYGVPPDYEMNDDDIGDSIPDMVDTGVHTDRIGSSAGLTNAGESVMLFYWDGTTDLVYDVDYIVWGDKAEGIDKTGEAKDGPDIDTDPTAYLDDTPVADQTVVNCDDDTDGEPHSSGMTAQRNGTTEGSETLTGGNGLTGHDETSEDMSVAGGSWTLDSAASPGEAPPTYNPPEIFGAGYRPCIPADGEDVTVKAYIKADAGVNWAKVFYSIDEGSNWSEVTMSNTPPDSLYEGVVPGQANDERVWYYIEAEDNIGQSTTNPMDGSYKYHVSVITPIATIQSDTTENGDSNYEDLPVNIEGTVTAGSGTYNDYVFYVSGDAENPVPWDGIKVYSYYGNPPVSVGDRVAIAGIVEEYYSETEVNANNSYADTTNCIEIIGSGVVNPLEVNTGDVAVSEDLEGLLVVAVQATVTDTMNQYGEWKIDDGSGECVVDDWAGYSYVPQIGDVLNVTGIVTYTYGEYKIEPRGDSDIEFGQPDVSIEVSNTPSEVQRRENARWKVMLTNNTSEAQVVDVWVSISSDNLPPKLNPYVVVLAENLTIPPFFSGRGWASLKVPGNAPFGTYAVENIVGTYPDDDWDSATFDCDVVP